MFHFGDPLRSPNSVPTTPPGPAPPTPTGYFSDTPPFSPSSSGPQDVSLEPAGSIPFSFGIRSPGKSSPLRGRNMKDYEEQLEHLKKENFSLKLRIYFMEEKSGHKGNKEDKEELYKANIELKVETEGLKKQLCDKQELLRQAAGLVTNMENQFKEQLQAIEEGHEQETQDLRATIETLKKDLAEYSEMAQQGREDLNQLCGLAFNNMEGYPDQNLIELNRPLKSNPLIPSNRLQGIFSMQDPVECELEERSRNAIKHSIEEAPEIIPMSTVNKIKKLEGEVERLTAKVKDLQETLDEKDRTAKALEEDIVNLKREIEDRDEKVCDLEFEVTEKDQKVDQLMQELETRHQEIKAKNTTIQTLHDDLNKVEPQIEVKVQEIIEKDRIIEEKTEQLQQQNKILVEIQITLDEKQKQISELEESLVTTKQKMEKLNHDFDFTLRTVKEMVKQIEAKDKEISQLKKEVKKKEAQVKDLLAELKEALEMLKKAKWEAENSGCQDSVKDMVEEENERLWAELEQQKIEIRQLREKEQALVKDMNDREKLFIKEKQELEEKLQHLQNQIANEARGERDKNKNKVDHLKEIIESRESLLRNQEGMIESLKIELAKAKEELVERKEEIRELKNELSKRNSDIHEFFTKELFGKNKVLGELQNKLLSMPLGKDNQLDILKLFLEANPINMPLKPIDTKESQNPCQARSSSLPKITETVARRVEKEKSPSQQSPKAGRSNSFSLLENLLYANMGQKVYNTNQTFNTYVLSGEVENNESEAIPMRAGSPVLSSDAKMGMVIHKDLENKAYPDLLLKEAVEVQGKNTCLKDGKIISTINEKSERRCNSGSESQTISGSAFQVLCEEVSNIRNEAEALKRDREILTEKVSALQTLNEHLANGSSLESIKAPMVDSQSSQTDKIEDSREIIQSCSDQINKLKGEYKDTKQKITLQVLQVASIKYQESLKNYKEEIISLRKRLADSHNACNLLRNRLEELLDFFEQILDMEKKGIINLSHLSDLQKSSLRKSLNDSRSLSHSLSHSLMIGMDSVLNESVATQNDAEASRFCLPTDTFTEEFELSHYVDLTLPTDQFDYSELSEPEPTKDFICYSFASKIHSQIDEKSKELDALTLKLNEVYNVLKSKDEDIEAKSLRIITLENQIAKLKEEISMKNQLSLQSHTSGSSGTVVGGKYSSFDTKSNSSLHLSALEHSAISPEIESKIAEEIFIMPQRESSSSDVLLPPPQSYISSSDDHVALFSGEGFSSVSDSQIKTRSTSQSDNASVYSTDSFFKNIPQYGEGSQDLKNVLKSHQHQSMSKINLEQPPLPPSFALASPSESEAWSEPDRNVSLARIGLETCNIVSITHDRSISRSRMTRSAPFTSESEGEANSEEVKEGSVGLGTAAAATSVTKPKRRSDASEIKRLSNKLKNLEQINEALNTELYIYHQTICQQSSPINIGKSKQQVSISSLDISSKEKSLNNEKQNLMELQQIDEENSSCVSAIPSSLFKEIRSLRMKLEEAITKNDLLRDQLEAALSGYLSEETKTLNIRLISLQQELKCNQEKLIIAYNTEQQLRLHGKQNESKMFELGERLADYITMNQKLQKDICELTKDLHNSKEKLSKTEKELEDTRVQIESRTGSPKQLLDSHFRGNESKINSLENELKMQQQSEKEKEVKIEHQRKYISDLEEANKDYESKLLEQESSIKELCQSITLLQQETNKSSMSDHLMTKLKEGLQNRETHILQITKERFALLGEKASLQAQLASATTRADLLQKEVRELSVSNDSIASESGNKGIVQRLQSSESTVKELLHCQKLWLSEKRTLQKEILQVKHENSCLSSHLDNLLSRKKVSDLQSTADASTLQSSYNSLKNEDVSLGNTYKISISEKNELESKVKEAESKEKDLKAIIKEREMKIEEIISQLDAERCLTKNLQIQIKRLQLNTANLKVPSDHERGFTSIESSGCPESKASQKSKVGKDRFSVWERSLPNDWASSEDKENRFPRYSNLSRGTHSLPIIDDDTTSGDSPDLGIGSDGQFSSLERLSITRYQREEQNKRLFKVGDPDKENIKRRLCSEPSHSHLLLDIQQLQEERDKLCSELTTTRENLKEALSQLATANQREESIQKAMAKQLTKTYDVLKKTKGNLARAKTSKIPGKQILSANQNEQNPQTG